MPKKSSYNRLSAFCLIAGLLFSSWLLSSCGAVSHPTGSDNATAKSRDQETRQPSTLITPQKVAKLQLGSRDETAADALFGRPTSSQRLTVNNRQHTIYNWRPTPQQTTVPLELTTIYVDGWLVKVTYLNTEQLANPRLTAANEQTIKFGDSVASVVDCLGAPTSESWDWHDGRVTRTSHYFAENPQNRQNAQSYHFENDHLIGN